MTLKAYNQSSPDAPDAAIFQAQFSQDTALQELKLPDLQIPGFANARDGLLVRAASLNAALITGISDASPTTIHRAC